MPYVPDSESVFEAWLEECEQGRGIPFSDLQGQYPDAADELHRLHDDWERARSALEDNPPSGLGQSLCEGDTLGPYRLIAELGRGGQGTVWKAEEISLGRSVALKVMWQDGDLVDATLFQREARAGGRLTHPAIVAVHASGTSDGVAWIAQELVGGGRTVRDLIAEMRDAPSIPATWYLDVAALVERIARALSVAHEAGVIHRDVKPQNVLLTPEGLPKVSDFGMARIGDETAVSKSGEVRGTYLYMSPEQVVAKRSAIDERTDVFSLGVVLYELLTLQRPFEGDTAHQICQRILSHDPPSPRTLRSQVPNDLAVISGKAIEKEPARRYPSMRAFAEDLAHFLAHEPIVASPPGPLQTAAKWTRRHPVWSVSSMFVAIGLVVVGTLSLQLDLRSNELAVSNVELTVERDRLRGFRQFLNELAHEKPTALQGTEEASMLSVLLSAEKRLAESANTDPLLEGMLRQFFGRMHNSLGNFAAGAEQLEAALSKMPEDLTVLKDLTQSYADLERWPDAEALYRSALRRFDEDDPRQIKFLTGLAGALANMQRQAEAKEVLARADMIAVTENDLLARMNIARHQGRMAYDSQDWPAYLDARKREYDAAQAHFGSQHPATYNAADNLGNALAQVEEYGEAERYYRIALDGMTADRGESHLHTSYVQNNLARLFIDSRRCQEALPFLQRAAETRIGNPSAGTSLVDSVLWNLTCYALETEDYRPALDRLIEAIEWFAELHGPSGEATLKLVHFYGLLSLAKGDPQPFLDLTDGLGLPASPPMTRFGRWVYVQSAEARMATGDKQGAVSRMEAFIPAVDDDAELQTRVGAIRVSLGLDSTE